jgi:hypothetical protein
VWLQAAAGGLFDASELFHTLGVHSVPTFPDISSPGSQKSKPLKGFEKVSKAFKKGFKRPLKAFQRPSTSLLKAKA